MKKIIFTVVFLFTMVNIHSQNINEASMTKNEVDLVLSDLLDGALQLKYERGLGEHFSVSLGLGYKGEDGLINWSGLNTEKIKTGGISYSGFKIIPEVRYYLKNNGHVAMKGFYLGAYLKYSNYQSDLTGRYITDDLESYGLDFKADINVTSLGLMVGYKLPITEKISVDFLIAGPGTGFYNFSLKNEQDLPDEFYEDLSEALNKYNIFDMLDGNFRFTATHRKSDFNLLTLRYGISVGYSF